jgi:hypothetical protein
MTMPRVEVITSVERRRRWSREEKERLVAESFEPGVTVSEVARAAGIHVSQATKTRSSRCRSRMAAYFLNIAALSLRALESGSPIPKVGFTTYWK